MTSTSTNPGRERAAATALSLVLDYNTDQLKKQAEKKNLTRKSALPECRAPHDDLRQLPGTRQRQPQATSRPIAPAPVPSDRHAPPERASASRYTSHRPRPGRLRQRRPNRGGDHGGYRDGKALKKCRFIPAIRAQITRPPADKLPTPRPSNRYHLCRFQREVQIGGRGSSTARCSSPKSEALPTII